jgi:hypothetical protein
MSQARKFYEACNNLTLDEISTLTVDIPCATTDSETEDFNGDPIKFLTFPDGSKLGHRLVNGKLDCWLPKRSLN